MSVSFWVGAVLIGCGLVWLWRAYSGEKAGVIVTLGRPEALLMSKRERLWALITGILNVVAGLLNLWVGLRHR